MASDGDRLLRQAVRYGGVWTTSLGALALLGAVAELLLPAALGRAVDVALAGGSPWWLVAACGLIAVLAATATLGDLAGGYGAARTTARLRHRLLRHLFALDPRTAGRRPVGDLVTRLISRAADAGQAGSAVVLGGVALLPPVGSVVALTLLEPWLGVTFVAGLILLGILMRAFVSNSSTAISGYQRVQGTIAARLLEALAGARTIAAAGTVHAEVTRVLEPLPQLHMHGRRTWHTLVQAATRTAAVAPLLQVAVVAVGGWSLAAGWLTAGQLFAALRYAALGAGLGAVVQTLNRLVRIRTGAHRAAEILAEPPRRYGTATLPAGSGALSLRNVTVRADDGQPILRGIDLDVPGGSAVAVVGSSGAGKSTLAAVAGRLRDPDAGEVLLDGVPLRRLDATDLRRAVGYGFDRPVLIGDTVADVIGMGVAGWTQPDGDASPADLHRAARAAAIDKFVERLPHGYRTRIADTPMSGGEAQRLGLARALAAERLLVLDDAAASLDTATEHRISQAMAEHAGARTRLIVTHRVGAAAQADLVVWLDGGRVRACGRHADLWRDPAYRAVFQPQPVVAG